MLLFLLSSRMPCSPRTFVCVRALFFVVILSTPVKWTRHKSNPHAKLCPHRCVRVLDFSKGFWAGVNVNVLLTGSHGYQSTVISIFIHTSEAHTSFRYYYPYLNTKKTKFSIAFLFVRSVREENGECDECKSKRPQPHTHMYSFLNKYTFKWIPNGAACT